jgi:DNA-binding NarL/FixJ family response regulator
MHDDEETFRSGLAAGARSLLHKTDSEQHMVAAISALSAHQTYFSPAVSQLLLSSALHKRSRSSLEHFTGRELEVAQLIAEGHSSKQVARRLDISPKTVECHRSAVMRKSGTHTVGELVRFAIRRNLIQA